MQEIAGYYRFGDPEARAEIELGSGTDVARLEHVLVTASARLDRRTELARRFGLPADESCAALIAMAYIEWGTDCLRRLEGDFSFALWDESERRLVCARDAMGVRPLYYYVSSTYFAFASRINTLLAIDGVPRRINEARAIDFLLGQVNDTATFYTDVRRLPPAHTAVVNNGRMSLRRYWQIDPNHQLHLASNEDYEEQYRALFTSAVAERLRSGGRIGSLLSGGVDSSSVVCTATSIRPHVPLDTYSMVFDLPDSDERRYVQAVADHSPIRAHVIQGTGLNPLAELDDTLDRIGEPFFTPNLFLNRRLWKEASKDGIDFMLDGFLGDQIVGHGSRRLTELFFELHWFRFARELRAAARGFTRPVHGAAGLFRRFVISPLLNADGMSAEFVRPEFHERVRQEREPRTDREEHLRELTSGIIPSALEIATISASEYGIEPCFPFADRHLVEFCYSVPVEQKCRGGRTRVYARRAMEARLPEAVQKRGGKANLSPVFRRGVLETGRRQMTETIYERIDGVSPYVDVESLQETWRKAIDQPDDVSTDTLLRMWYVVVFARWLEREKERSAASSAHSSVVDYARG